MTGKKVAVFAVSAPAECKWITSAQTSGRSTLATFMRDLFTTAGANIMGNWIGEFTFNIFFSHY